MTGILQMAITYVWFSRHEVIMHNLSYGYLPRMVGWLNWKQDAAILLSWVIVTVWIAVKHPACKRAFIIYKLASEQVKNPVKIGPEKVTRCLYQSRKS